MVEQLFELPYRQAVRLMALVRRPRAREANLIPCEQMLAWLDKLLSTRPARDALERRRQLKSGLEAAVAAGDWEEQARSITVTRAEADNGLAGWHLAAPPGQFAIELRSAPRAAGARACACRVRRE